MTDLCPHGWPHEYCGLCHEEEADDEEIAQVLRKAEARYQRAFRRSEQARDERNTAVRAALEAGWTHARIAEATGLTRGRVGQIALQR